MVQKGPDQPKMVPNGQKHFKWPLWCLLDPFGPLLIVDNPAMFGHFWSKIDQFWAIPSLERWPPKWKKAHHHKVSYLWPACRTPKHPVWIINMTTMNEKCKKWVNIQWRNCCFFCHFLLWMASYGPEGSFLLIFWARDDLVKVLWKWDTWKCQTNLPSLLKEASLYEKEKDKNIFKIFRSRKSDGKIVAGTKMKKRFLSGIRSDTLELWEALDIKCIVLEAPSYPCSTQTGQKG